MARHAFISHSHKDADAAGAIVSALESRGVKCWTAPRDVTPGGSYAESIITAIENSSCFVLVYTAQANVSPHVLREVERALALGINIIPLRFDDSNVSKSLDYLLATVHWLSVIAEPRQKAISHAAERIASCVAHDGELAATTPAPVPLESRKRRTPLAMGIGLLVVALAVIALSATTVQRLVSRKRATPEETASPGATVAALAVVDATAAPAATPLETPEATAIAEANAATPAAPLFPNRAPFRDSPLSAVRRYYNYLSDRNTIKAYELLSTNYRSHEDFVNYTRAFASTTGLRLSNSRLLSNNGRTASVSVTFQKNNQKFGWIQWSGPVEVVLEDGGWHIDSTRGLHPSRGHR